MDSGGGSGTSYPQTLSQSCHGPRTIPSKLGLGFIRDLISDFSSVLFPKKPPVDKREGTGAWPTRRRKYTKVEGDSLVRERRVTQTVVKGVPRVWLINRNGRPNDFGVPWRSGRDKVYRSRLCSSRPRNWDRNSWDTRHPPRDNAPTQTQVYIPCADTLEHPTPDTRDKYLNRRQMDLPVSTSPVNLFDFGF